MDFLKIAAVLVGLWLAIGSIVGVAFGAWLRRRRAVDRSGSVTSLGYPSMRAKEAGATPATWNTSGDSFPHGG
jgi:hypothetical protein